MHYTNLLGLLAVAGSAAAQTQYTASSSAAVAAAAATVLTNSPTSKVKGKAFDRIMQIYLETTDYHDANRDR